MRLTAFKLQQSVPTIRPAPAARDWMNATRERFAYRCLPLTVANTHGWEILCPSAFEVYWNGGPGIDDVRVLSLDPPVGETPSFVASHFGAGVFTFHTGYLFQTEAGIDLYVTGPVNRPRDGAAALTGIVETDWLPQAFTMNWIFTTPGGPVTFEAGEPFCHLFPVARGALERVAPEIRELESEPELMRRHQEWVRSRAAFNVALREPGSAAQEEGWQKNYLRGQDPDGAAGPTDHRTKVKLREFEGPTG